MDKFIDVTNNYNNASFGDMLNCSTPKPEANQPIVQPKTPKKLILLNANDAVSNLSSHSSSIVIESCKFIR